VARSPAIQRVAERVPLPPSPADVANAIERSSQQFQDRVVSLYDESGVTAFLEDVREKLSSIIGLEFLAWTIEGLGLQSSIADWIYLTTIPSTHYTHAQDIAIPNLFNLLKSQYWYPNLLWLSTSMFIPLLVGYFFNSTIAAKSHIHRMRTRSSKTSEYPIDPLSFNIAKALVSWLVYAQGVRFGGLVSDLTVARVNQAMPLDLGYMIPITLAVIGGIKSIYQAILEK